MMQIQFTVPGAPVPKGRPRFRVVQPKTETVVDAVTKEGHKTMIACIRATVAATIKGAFVSTYTPSETVTYEETVAWHAKAAMRGIPPTDRAVEVRMELRMPIPPSWSKKKQAAALAGVVRATNKPDADNCAKGIKDACNKIVWEDDSQVVLLSVRKLYSDVPCVVMAVRDLEGTPA